MNIKIKWLRDRLRTQNLQGMIVSNPVNIKYLIGIEAEGTLLITLKENLFITDSRYVEAVNTILTIEDEILVNDKKNLTKDDYAAFFMFCENVGFDEYFSKGGVSIVEWSDLICDCLPEEKLVIKFKVIDENTRVLVFEPHGKQYEDLCANVL